MTVKLGFECGGQEHFDFNSAPFSKDSTNKNDFQLEF